MTPACILVVEDEASVRALIRRILEFAGLDVLVAMDGPAAVALFTQQPARIDLVLLDLCMPGLDGLQTLDQLLAIRPDVRAVLMSGYSADVPAGSPALVGMIQKPFLPAQLVALVRSALGRGPAGPS